MNTDIFVDGVINIALVKGMIRVEFGSYSASEKGADGGPAIFNKYQLVLTPQAFLETFGNMERMLNLLKDKGVVREGQGEQRDGPARDTDSSFSAKDRRGTGQERRQYAVEPR